MNIAELTAAVYVETSRPDLADKTLAAVKAATLKIHSLDYYWRDIYENEIDFTTSADKHIYDYTVGLARFRALKYLRHRDKVSGVNTDTFFFQIIEPEQILDGYNIDRENVVYFAGTQMIVKALAAFRYGYIAYYRHPDITDGGFSSWIANEHPYAIVYEAARTILKTIGRNSEATALQATLAEEIAAVKITGLQARGY